MSAFIAPLLGTVVGGMIALASNLYFARRKERDERLALGYSVLFKVQKIVDLVRKVRQHVNRSPSPDDQAWRAISSLHGTRGEPVEFTPMELAIFARKKDTEFTQILMDAASYHGLMLELVEEYNRRKQTLSDAMSEVVREHPEDPTSFKIEGEDLTRLRPKILETNSVALNLRNVANDIAFPLDVLRGQTGPRIRQILADTRFDLTFGDETGKSAE